MSKRTRPEFDASEINKAARILVANASANEKLDSQALAIVNNWRSAHDYALNGIHMTMKGRAKRIVGGNVDSAQRIKRLESILLKLGDRPTMKLSQMQDIGGCRVILPSIKDVYALRDMYDRDPPVHEALTPKDYVDEPVPDSGYRSLHLKYRFKGRGTSLPWDGLKIEMQIRTQLQHQWATAVETAGALKDQAFKSRRGDLAWRRFFTLVSSLFASHEGCPLVPSTPTNISEIVAEIRDLNTENHILSTLRDYAATLKEIKQKGAGHYFVMRLSPLKREVEIWQFSKSEAGRSTTFMEELERATEPPGQVVRVTVESLDALRRAYPNYFLDTTAFTTEVQRALDLAG